MKGSASGINTVHDSDAIVREANIIGLPEHACTGEQRSRMVFASIYRNAPVDQVVPQTERVHMPRSFLKQMLVLTSVRHTRD